MEPERSTQPETSQWPSIFQTGGQILDDGTVLELVEDVREESGFNLLKWDGAELVQAPFIEHSGRTYVPVLVDRTIRLALRLPSRVAPYASIKTLRQEMLALAARYTDLPEQPREQVVDVILATWVADLLPVPVNAWLWSPSAVHAVRVLQLLHCLCRVPLLLAGANVAELRALPVQLPATLLVLRPAAGRRMREWMTAAGWRNFPLTRSGRLIQTFGPKVFAADAPLSKPVLDPVLEIPIPPSRRLLPPFDAKRQREIAAELLPKLLQFRLDYASRYTAEPADFDGWDTSGLLTGEPDLSDIRLGDPRVILLEVLLARCHEEGRQEIYVAEIALDVNAARNDAGATSTLSDRLLGSLLKSIGLFTRSLGRRGRGLRLDRVTRRAIHRLAGSYGVPSARQPFPGCAECSRG